MSEQKKPPPIPAKPVRHTIQTTPVDPPPAAAAAPAPPSKIEADAPPPPPQRQASDVLIVRERAEDRPLPPPPPGDEPPAPVAPQPKKPHPPREPPPSSPGVAQRAPSPGRTRTDDQPKRPHPPREPPRNMSPSPNQLDNPEPIKKPHPPKAPPPTPVVASSSADDVAHKAVDAAPLPPTPSPVPGTPTVSPPSPLAASPSTEAPVKRSPHPPREPPPGGSQVSRAPHPPRDPPPPNAERLQQPQSRGRPASPGQAEEADEKRRHDELKTVSEDKKDKRSPRSLTPEADASRHRSSTAQSSGGSAVRDEKRTSSHRRTHSVQVPTSPKEDHHSSSKPATSHSRDRDRDRDREKDRDHHRGHDSHHGVKSPATPAASSSSSRDREGHGGSRTAKDPNALSPSVSHDSRSGERRHTVVTEVRLTGGDDTGIGRTASQGERRRSPERTTKRRSQSNAADSGSLVAARSAADEKRRSGSRDDAIVAAEKRRSGSSLKGSDLRDSKERDGKERAERDGKERAEKDGKEKDTARKEDPAKRTVRRLVRSRSSDDLASALVQMTAPSPALPPKPARPHPPAPKSPSPVPAVHVLAASHSAVQLSGSVGAPAPAPLSSSPSSPSPVSDVLAAPNAQSPAKPKPPPVPSRPERVLRPQQGGSLIARTALPQSDGAAEGAEGATEPAPSPKPASARRRLSLDGTRRSTEPATQATGQPPPEFAAQLLNILKDIKPKDLKELPAGKPADDIEAWPSAPRQLKKWPQFDAHSDMLVINWAEYAVELGETLTLASFPPLTFEDEERCTAYYESALAKHPHFHWLARNEEHGPVVISIEKVKDRRMRVLIRTKKQDERMLLPPNSKKKLALVLDVYPMFAPLKFRKVPAEKLQETLIQFERKTLESVRYKFGVLYCRAGQKEENQWYANQEKDQSAAFTEFLNVIGDRIKMKGWDKFCGGLDNKYGTTGEHSVYAAYKGCEVMYHVSTLLPFYPDDVQQVERKRHLGNDVCLVVFRDPGCAPFDPMIIKSQFNHIFAIIEPAKEPGKYRMQFAYKIGVSYFGPPFPAAPQPANNAFREFLITKLINGQRAAMYAPDFRGKNTRTRRTLMQEFVPEDEAGGAAGNVTSAVGNMFRRTLLLGKGGGGGQAPAEV